MTASVLRLSTVAQTNVELYRQMHDLGFAPEALRLARDAYQLVRVPFAGHYRACGKPFVCHLVGTASIIASLDREPELVAAAVLHSVYEPSFRGGNNRGGSLVSPQRIRDTLGIRVEEYVAGYRDMSWKPDAIRDMAREASTNTGFRARVLLLRLANELDDRLDYSMAYCSEARAGTDAAFDHWVGMAEALGYPALAEGLREIRREERDAAWARPLGEGRATSHTVLAEPESVVSRLRDRLSKLKNS